MGKLSQEQLKAYQKNNKLLKSQEKELLTIYQSSLKEIRNDMFKMSDRADWTLNDMLKYNRLTTLEKEVLIEIKKINEALYKSMVNTNKQVVKNTYNQSWYGYEKETSINIDFDKIDAATIEAIVKNPYPNVKLKDLIKDLSASQVKQLKIILGSGLTQGKSITKIAQELKGMLEINYTRALRIARTESARASSKAHLKLTQQAEDMGIKIVKVWHAVLDNRTRDSHAEMDGKRADEDGLFDVNGVIMSAPQVVVSDPEGNLAAETINCRCDYLEEVDDIGTGVKERWDNEYSEMIDDMTYEEWVEYRK